jgi:uncharacterized peroxidase-related enzyme
MTNEMAPLTDTQAPPAARDLFRMIQQKFGMVPNLFRVLGHHPAFLSGFLQLYEAIQHDLPARWREMAYLRASSINHCNYCMQYHRIAAGRAGLTEQEIDAVVTGDIAGVDDRDRAVLRFADQLNRTTEVDAATIAKLREFLSESQFVTLVMTVAVGGVTSDQSRLRRAPAMNTYSPR